MATIMIVVDDKTRHAFKQACLARRETMSEVLRRYIASIVKTTRQQQPASR